MIEQIIVVDDLYDIAHQYHKGFFENQCVITDETGGKISQILGKPIEIVSASNQVNGTDEITSRSDCDWIAVIYLTLPLTSFGEQGLKFFTPEGKEYGNIVAKYNRMVLFRANLLHSYGTGYGDNLNNSMLYQRIFVKDG